MVPGQLIECLDDTAGSTRRPPAVVSGVVRVECSINFHQICSSLSRNRMRRAAFLMFDFRMQVDHLSLIAHRFRFCCNL